MKKINIIIPTILIFLLFFSVIIPSYATSETNNIETITEQKNNNFLKSLSVEGYELSPEFNKNIETYYVAIPQDVSYLEILAETEVDNATLKITGNTNLNKTENTIKVTVTSQNRKTKTYNIIASKQKENGLNLTELTVDKGTLSPDFNSSTHYYTLDIKSDKEKTNLGVNAKANLEGTNIEVFGDKELEDGENFVTIVLQNGSNTTTYEILVNVTVEKVIITENESKDFINVFMKNVKEFFSDTSKVIAFLSVVAIILLILIICVIIKIIKNNKINKNKERLKNRAK